MHKNNSIFINGLKKLFNDIYRLRIFILLLCAVFIIFNLLFHKICITSIISGYPCPGCGITRAFACILTFRWREALVFNPTIFIWLPVLAFGFLNRYFFNKSGRIFTILLISAGIITIITYVIRMLTLFPDTEPMTYYEHNLINFLTGLFRK